MNVVMVAWRIAAKPATAFAQAASAGGVRDLSGTPLPGVRVETAGSASIEICLAISTVADVHSATCAFTLCGSVMRSLPTARSNNALLVIVAGVVRSLNDTLTGAASVSFPSHGGRSSEGRLLLDGWTIGRASGNSVTGSALDLGQTQEVAS